MKETPAPPVAAQQKIMRTRVYVDLNGPYNKKHEGGYLDWPLEIQEIVLEAIASYNKMTGEPWQIEPASCVCKFDLEAGHWYLGLELSYVKNSTVTLQ